MVILLLLSAAVCGLLIFLYIRIRLEIRSLCLQLEEIRQGSHLELTVSSRQQPLLALCRELNRLLSARDENHIRHERAEKQLKQNITDLAHDIRTPLTGASGYLQLALECEEPGKKGEYLRSVRRRLIELEDMLEKLFLYTKLTNEAFLFSPENLKNIQILPLLGDCLLSLYAEFEKKRMTPKISFASEGFQVRGDEDALRRIFLNLLQNALLHGTGDLSVIQEPENCLAFENAVPETASLNPGQIFDRFYKADQARRKGSSGLGLFIVKELMKRMGGDAQAEFEEGKLRILLSFPPLLPPPGADHTL